MYRIHENGTIVKVVEPAREGRPERTEIVMRVVYNSDPHGVFLGARLVERLGAQGVLDALGIPSVAVAGPLGAGEGLHAGILYRARTEAGWKFWLKPPKYDAPEVSGTVGHEDDVPEAFLKLFVLADW